jgi:hypothetical protein
MENILIEFNQNLIKILEANIPNKEKKIIANQFDTLSTLITLSKTEKVFKELLDSACLDREIIDYNYSKNEIDDLLSKGLLKTSNFKGINKIHITFLGLYELYKLNNWDFSFVFKQIDSHKFPKRTLKLKIQEKLWCIFLILIEADSKDNLFDTNITSNEKLEEYHKFIQIIEQTLINSEVKIGNKVNWNQGKDKNLRSFITNTVDLPKTGIYGYSGKKYFLDLTTKGNAKLLLDLILDGYEGQKRIIINELLKNCLFKLSGKLLTELNENHSGYNKFIKNELS